MRSPRPTCVNRPAGVLIAALALAHATPAGAVLDMGKRLDANRLGLEITNFGSFGFDITTGNGGLEFPLGSGRSCLFAGGLWVGARVSGEVRVTLAEYSFDYVPGPMAGGTFQADRPEFRVYELNAFDTTGTAAWMTQAVPQGAPTQAGGTAPGGIGAQTLWSVYNDANPTAHTTGAGNTPPLGIEVRQTSWAWDENSPRASMAFLRFQIRNAGAQTLDSTWIGLWSDVDLGGASDDRFGSDPARRLAYVYNGAITDNVYGTTPPAVGFVLLKGPRLTPAGPPSEPRAMITYPHADPMNAVESYRLLRGLKTTGAAWVDTTTGLPTTFAFTGDPTTGSGWVMGHNNELRMMQSAGPFTMAPGDTQDVVMAIVVGQGVNHLDSIRRLRELADSISLEGSVAAGPPVVPWPPPVQVHVLTLAPLAMPLVGALRFELAAPLGAAWRLDLFDARGRRVARAGEGVGTGFTQSVETGPGRLAPGVYWAALSTPDDRVARRIVVLGR